MANQNTIEEKTSNDEYWRLSTDPGLKNWSDILEKVRSEAFSSPWKDPDSEDKFGKYMAIIIDMEEKMHFPRDSTQPYIKHPNDKTANGQGTPNYSYTNLAKVPDSITNIEAVIRYLLQKMFNCMNNPHHPLFVANVLPPPSLAGLLGAIIGMKLNANIVDQHFSLNVSKAELELASMVCNLLPVGHGDDKWPKPWAPVAPDSSKHFEVAGVTEEGHGSGGISTFGGTGCYLYGVKYGLVKVANSGGPPGYNCRRDGFEQGKFVIMCSSQGHYVHTTTSDWTGLGYGNAIFVATKEDNTMDHADLIRKMNEAKNHGKVVVAVIPTFGTTDAGALEDVREIRKIIRNFDNIQPYCKPILYADSVIGWVWLFFRDYDFDANPLGFRTDILEQIKFNAERAAGLVDADAFGTDFHKTGYTHYVSSMFMIKDFGEYASLLQRDPPPFLQQEQYDPALYTLETSRSPSGIIGTWATFKHLGKDGMRSIMYNLLDKQDYLRKLLRETGCTVICNEQNHLHVTLFRVSAFHYTPEAYDDELRDESKYEKFRHINEFQKLVYLRMYEELRKNSCVEARLTPHISMTAGFRHTYYNPDGKKLEPDSEHPMQDVFALKCYLCSPFTDYCHMDLIVAVLMEARLRILDDLLKKASHPLYKKIVDIVYDERPNGVHPHRNMISAKFIPTRNILPKNFDESRDPEYQQIRNRLQEEATEVQAKIAEITRKIIGTNISG